MLVLSRNLNESIQIGDNITVTVCRIQGDKVRLAIDAPKNIVVHRAEVAERIKAIESACTHGGLAELETRFDVEDAIDNARAK